MAIAIPRKERVNLRTTDGGLTGFYTTNQYIEPAPLSTTTCT